MRTVVFDLETSSLYADTAILLCACLKEYRPDFSAPVVTIRADSYRCWRNKRSKINHYIIGDLIDALKPYDVLVAHNGQFFDKPMITSWALQHNRPVDVRFKKFIDPVHLSKRHMRTSRRSLQTLIRFFDIPEDKTHIEFRHWLQAAMDGNRQSMGYIVTHCIQDVKSLEMVYDRVRHLVKGIDERGSAY